MPSPRRSIKPEPTLDTGWATASEIAAAVTDGRVSALQVTENTLSRIMERDPVFNSFTDVVRERACERARAIDAAHAAGKPPGPLAGAAVSVKKLVHVKDVRARAGYADQ